jgi:molybdopterin-guanine dinucleotide biosynthesis protein A
LAGGEARRMGGAIKPLLQIRGQPLLAEVVTRLQPQCQALLLSINGDPAPYENFGLPMVTDDLPERAGPLAGLLAGLDWTAEHRPDVTHVISAPADTPFLPHDLVERLTAARRADEADIACAASGERIHPVIGLWPVSIRADMRDALTCGERKVERFASRYSRALARWPVEPIDPFFNINTADDLAGAERLCAQLDAKS